MDLSQILWLFYPQLVGSIATTNSQGELLSAEAQYATLVVTNGSPPPLQDLVDLWPETQSYFVSQSELLEKEKQFQTQYPIQSQLVTIMRAVSTGDKTDLNTMLNYWDAL